MELKTEYGTIRVTEKGAALTYWHHIVAGREVSLIYSPSYDTSKENPDYSGVIVAPRAGRYLFNEQDGIELHSGNNGVSDNLFTLNKEGNSITAELKSSSSGYRVVYTLSGEGLDISIEMTPEEKILINPTSHLYFSVNGNSADEHFLSTGTCIAVSKTGDVPTGIDMVRDELDFVSERKISDTKIDDCFILGDEPLKLSADGIRLELTTDAPAAVVYTYDFPRYTDDLRRAVAIEPQDPPNSQSYDEYGCLHRYADSRFTRNIRWKVSSDIKD